MDDKPDLPETATGDASQTSSNTTENALSPQSASARTQSPFAVLAQAMRLMSTNAKLLDSREESKKLAIALHQQLQDSWPELKSLHLPVPESLDDWSELAQIAEIARAEIGTLSADDIHAEAIAWAQRIKIKYKLEHDASNECNTKSGTVPTGESKVVKEKKRNADKSDGRPKTKRDKLRDQRLKICVPLHNKGQTWSPIFLAYYKKFPSDEKASPDTLRLTFARNSDDI